MREHYYIPIFDPLTQNVTFLFTERYFSVDKLCLSLVMLRLIIVVKIPLPRCDNCTQGKLEEF